MFIQINETYNTAGQLMSLTARNGKTTTRSWNVKEGTLASYSWGLDEYASRALKWDVRGNITEIEKRRADSPYKNKYRYDNRNRLVLETNGAKVRKGSSILTNASYRYAANDVSGKADGAFSSETVRLDYNASSVIIDLGSDMEVNQVNIYGRNSRISPEYLELWTKKAGSESWDKAEDESLNWKQTAEGWTVYFTGGITAKKVKLHSTWDERDADYSAVDKSTFSAPAGNIFEVMFTANGKTNFWTYDAKGNRLTENETTGGIYTSRQEITYYPNTDLIKQYGEWYFNYDRNGSLTARGTETEKKETPATFEEWTFAEDKGELWTYEYDLSNRMIKASHSRTGSSNLKVCGTYKYDYRGLLVKKAYTEFTAVEGVTITEVTETTKDEYYEYNQNGQLIYKESGSEVTDYIWAESTLWCEVDDGKVYYHHTDHLGTTEAVTDETGRVVWSAEYEAFGSVLSENGSMTFTPSFTGKMLDECSGLYYFNARWYDSEMGRFTTQDPARDGFNWLMYCRNRPLIMIDKNGKEVPPQYQERNNQKSEESRYELARKHSLLNEIEMNWNSDLDLQNYIKNNSVIEITRNVDDNENNGKYYRSDVKLKVGDVTIFESKIQSTADHSKLNNGEPRYEGRTIDPGDYVGTLLNKSGTYLNAISITGNDVSESEGVLMHPDAKTALGQTESYSSIRKPSSLACQILELNNFDKMINSIHNLGFKSGKAPVSDPNLSWCKGDKINIKIKEAE